jgi:hypothetical protein
MTISPNPSPQQQVKSTKIMFRVEPSEPVPSSFTIGEFLQDALDIGMKCWQPFLIMGFIVCAFNFIVINLLIFAILAGVVAAALLPKIGVIIIAIGIILTLALVVSLVAVWLYGGEIAYSLALVRGEQPPVSVLFSGMQHFWGILIAGANITVIVLCVDFVLLIATGIPVFFYIASVSEPSPFHVAVVGMIALFGYAILLLAAVLITTLFFLTYFFVVDRRQGPVEAMKSSYRFVRTQFWRVLGSVLLIFVCIMAVSMIPLVGALLSVPVALCLYTVLYLKITGQPHGLVPAS